jgi:DNA-cytosine methyltransferase
VSTAIERRPYITVREAIGDLPEPVQSGSDVGIYEWDHEDYYRDAYSGLILPRTDYQREMRAEPEIPEAAGTAISLFSGCGGFDLGTTMAGFETRAFIEMDKDAVKTILHNAAAFGWLNAVVFNCDIRKIEVQQVLYAARLERGECSLVTGGFPCQPFSVSGARKGTKDDRGNLFYECARMIDGIQPRTFCLENVPGILTSSKGEDIKVICREFVSLGYDFCVTQLNAVDYGVPQDRMRVFFMGVRADVAQEKNGAIELARNIVDGATNYDPDTGMPSFAPIWRWDGYELQRINEPAPGQVSGSVNSAKHKRDSRERQRSENPSLFEEVA